MPKRCLYRQLSRLLLRKRKEEEHIQKMLHTPLPPYPSLSHIYERKEKGKGSEGQ